jgi:shikimate kinase
MAKDIETLKAIYKERQETYRQLCDSLVAAQDAVNRIMELTDAAQEQMMATGQELLEAMGALSK